MAAVALTSCGNGSAPADQGELAADTLTHHARYLTIAQRPDGAVLVDIADPWSAGYYSYALVHRDSVLPADLPSKATVIRTPVERAAVYAQVYTSAMDELGAIDALAAIADSQFFTDNDTVASLLNQGRITDLGTSQSPSAELLAASGSQVVLRSPYEGMTTAPPPPGLVPVECLDYMESSPIGRAEWMLLFGELFGKREQAKAVFEDVIDKYSSLAFKVGSSSTPKPKLLVETETSGVWYVPAGESYAARLYADAGAAYPWADSKGQGSLALSLEEVASKALDADLWLVRSFGYETTPASLKALNPRYASFKALKEGNVYSCDTSVRLIFNNVAFHPERLLADYVAIFHPDVLPDYQPRYFIKQSK